MNPDEIEAFLREPIIADLATIKRSGAPHVAPVWFLWRGGKLITLSQPTAVKVRNIRNDSRVSLSIATNSQPYKYVIVSGAAGVSEPNTPEVPELLSTIAAHYKGTVGGAEYVAGLAKDIKFVIITVTPTKISGWAE